MDGYDTQKVQYPEESKLTIVHPEESKLTIVRRSYEGKLLAQKRGRDNKSTGQISLNFVRCKINGRVTTDLQNGESLMTWFSEEDIPEKRDMVPWGSPEDLSNRGHQAWQKVG